MIKKLACLLVLLPLLCSGATDYITIDRSSGKVNQAPFWPANVQSNAASLIAGGYFPTIAAMQVADAARVLTNSLGRAVNVLTAGVVANSVDANTVATNTLIMSNLFNAGGTYLIPDVIYHRPITVWSNAPRLTVLGYGWNSQLNSVGATNTWGIDCRSHESGWLGITFNYGQNIIEPVSPSEAWANSDLDAINMGGALRISAVGFPKVLDCEFRDVAGTALAVITEPHIESRSNHLMIANSRFYHNYNAIAATGTNGIEYCTIANNMGSRNRNWNVAVNDANGLIVGNNFNGWEDTPGASDGIVSGTGLRFRTVNNRDHTTVTRNLWNHFRMSVDIDGRTIVGGVTNVAGEAFYFQNNFAGGSASNYIGYFSRLDVAGCYFDSYATNAGTVLQAITTLSASGVTWKGRVQNGSGVLPFWYGRSWHQAGAHSTAEGGVNSGWSTNDYEYFTKGATIGNAVFARNVANGIGNYPGAIIRVVAGGNFNGGLFTEGMAYANGVMTSNYVGFINKATFQPADGNYAVSVSGNEMVLGHWSGGKSDLGVMQFNASFANGYFNVSSNNAGKVLEYTNTASGKGFVVTTNADVFVSGDSIVRGFQTNHNTLAISNELQSLASPLKVRPGSGQGRVSLLQWPGDVGVGAIKLNSAIANTTNYSLRADGSAGDSTLVSGGGTQGLELQYYGQPQIVMTNFGFTRFKTNVVFDGGFFVFTTTRASPPTLVEIGGTNRIADWMSNGFPPVRFSSVYHAANTSTPATTNFGLPLPGP